MGAGSLISWHARAAAVSFLLLVSIVTWATMMVSVSSTARCFSHVCHLSDRHTVCIHVMGGVL
jgi:hypothetical protein